MGESSWQNVAGARNSDFMLGLVKRGRRGSVARMNTLLVKKPAGKKQATKKPVSKKKDSWLGSAKGMWLDPNYDFTKLTCPHWT